MVSAIVLRGAWGGYLVLGLAGGLLFCGLETMQSGSDIGADGTGLHHSVWGLNFAPLHDVAFVSLTTMEYGDVVPQAPAASLGSVMVAIAITVDVAAVMGYLASRLTIQESEIVDKPSERL